MERILDENERIRRAEEIYLKRNNRSISMLQNGEAKEKRYFGSKILLHLLVLFNIAIVVFCLQNKDYIFTEEFLTKCNQYNINISEKINELIKNFLVEDSVKGYIENNKENTSNQENILENVVSQNQVQNQTIENTSTTNEVENVESSSLSEMELDIENLKKIYKFVKPLDAPVSSEFGARESKYQNVSGYHTGIDLAAEEGTPIKAAMQGIVTLVSNEGDYR